MMSHFKFQGWSTVIFFETRMGSSSCERGTDRIEAWTKINVSSFFSQPSFVEWFQSEVSSSAHTSSSPDWAPEHCVDDVLPLLLRFSFELARLVSASSSKSKTFCNAKVEQVFHGAFRFGTNFRLAFNPVVVSRKWSSLPNPGDD